MTIRIISTESDFDKMYSLYTVHKKIGHRPFSHKTKEDFMRQMTSTGITTFGYFDENDNLNAFVIGKKLSSIPSWYFGLYMTVPQSKFNLKTKFLGEVLEVAVKYYESHGLFNFFWIQTVKHRSFVNGLEFQKDMPDTYSFKNYLAPGFTFEKVKANTRSKYQFIDELCQGLVFPTDIVVKWTGNMNKNADFVFVDDK